MVGGLILHAAGTRRGLKRLMTPGPVVWPRPADGGSSPSRHSPQGESQVPRDPGRDSLPADRGPRRRKSIPEGEAIRPFAPGTFQGCRELVLSLDWMVNRFDSAQALLVARETHEKPLITDGFASRFGLSTRAVSPAWFRDRPEGLTGLCCSNPLRGPLSPAY